MFVGGKTSDNPSLQIVEAHKRRSKQRRPGRAHHTNSTNLILQLMAHHSWHVLILIMNNNSNSNNILSSRLSENNHAQVTGPQIRTSKPKVPCMVQWFMVCNKETQGSKAKGQGSSYISTWCPYSPTDGPLQLGDSKKNWRRNQNSCASEGTHWRWCPCVLWSVCLSAQSIVFLPMWLKCSRLPGCRARANMRRK